MTKTRLVRMTASDFRTHINDIYKTMGELSDGMRKLAYVHGMTAAAEIGFKMVEVVKRDLEAGLGIKPSEPLHIPTLEYYARALETVAQTVANEISFVEITHNDADAPATTTEEVPQRTN